MLPMDGLQILKNDIDLARINEEENRQAPQFSQVYYQIWRGHGNQFRIFHEI